MKKKLVRFLSVLLCFALISSVAAVFGAAEYRAEQDYSMYPELGDYTPRDAVYPTIILPGISHSVSTYSDWDGNPILDANGNEISTGLLLLDQTKVKDYVLGLVPELLTSLAIQYSSAKLSDKVYETVHNLMSIQQMDKDGEPVNNLVLKTYEYPVSQMPNRGWFYRMLPMEPVAKMFGEDNVYLYTFPLYGNPMDSAEGLKSYISMVKAQTGADKVNLVTVSLGGSILSAYLDSNPDFNEINKIINIVSLLNGTDLIADFMSRDFNISDQFLYSDYIPMIIKESTGSAALGYLLNILLRILPKQTFYDVLTAAFSALLDTVILNDPQFWAMLPGDRYEALADRYLRDGAHDVLLAKTDRYQQARLHLRDNMLAAADAGVKIYSISGYNLSYTDGDYNFFGIVSSSATANSDGVIPIRSTSLGANAVPAGTQFSAEYLANADMRYVSPDRGVDASTCLFPDRAWFFYNQHHEIGRDDIAIRLACAILGGYVDDVSSMPAFPQFNTGRNTRALVRSDSGLIFKAQAVLDDTTGAYTDAQKATVQTAYDDARRMLADTIGDPEAAASATVNLQNALATAGVGDAHKSSSIVSNLFERLMKALNDYVMRKIGGQGYIDYINAQS